MKLHKDMKKDMTMAMDKALRSVSRDKLSKASWFSREEETAVNLKNKKQPNI